MTETVDVVTMTQIRQALGVQYTNQQVFKEWLEATETPAPYARINGTSHWLKSQIQDFKILWEAHVLELSQARIKELSSETVTKMELLTALAEHAKRTERFTSHCYKGGRGTHSMQSGRIQAIELAGAINFVNRFLGGDNSIPPILREEARQSWRRAKSNVQMD